MPALPTLSAARGAIAICLSLGAAGAAARLARAGALACIVDARSYITFYENVYGITCKSEYGHLF